jgi:hypothetical protein
MQAFDYTIDRAVVGTGLLVASRAHRDSLNIVKHLYLSRKWFNVELCMHWAVRSMGIPVTVLNSRYERIFMDYPEFEHLEVDHIHRRMAIQDPSLISAWKTAFTVHYTIPVEAGGNLSRYRLMLEGRKYFYGK